MVHLLAPAAGAVVGGLCHRERVWTPIDDIAACRALLSSVRDPKHLCVLLVCDSRYVRRQESREYQSYQEALDLLLERLRDMQAVVEYASARSNRGLQILQGAANLKNGPVRLDLTPSVSALRMEILSLVDVAEYPLSSRIAPESAPVMEHVEIAISVPGYTADNLGDLGSRLGGPAPQRVTGGIRATSASVEPVMSSQFHGDLERLALVRARREQAHLRRMLAGDAQKASCAICGNEYPIDLLVAAHIKKRSACSEAERRDLANVAMLACALGCDSLYEDGWITVGFGGMIQVFDLERLDRGALKERLRGLRGGECSGYSAGSEKYFAWHRSTVFRGAQAVGPF